MGERIQADRLLKNIILIVQVDFKCPERERRNDMVKIKNYVDRFIKDESGMELMQFAIVVVITAGLIAVAMTIRDTTSKAITNANQIADEEFNNALNGSGK